MPDDEEVGLKDLPGQVGKAAYEHEVHPPDRAGAHRLLATGMLVTFLVVAISQDWWKHLRDFIGSKTHGPSTVTSPGGNDLPVGKNEQSSNVGQGQGQLGPPMG